MQNITETKIYVRSLRSQNNNKKIQFVKLEFYYEWKYFKVHFHENNAIYFYISRRKNCLKRHFSVTFYDFVAAIITVYVQQVIVIGYFIKNVNYLRKAVKAVTTETIYNEK